MPFSVSDFHDLIRLLEERPEWSAELRRHVLSKELLELPDLVRQLAQAQARTEQRVDAFGEAQARTEQRLEELAQAQARTERRLEELTQAQARTEQRLEELAQAQAQTEQRLEELARAMVHIERRLANLEGEFRGSRLEQRYRDRPDAYFGRFLRRLRVHAPGAVVDQYEQQLSREALDDLLLAELLVQGQLRDDPARGDIWLVVEISAKVDKSDLERALKRASRLREVGVRALPVVAGINATQGAQERAARDRVVLFQDGRVSGWDEALAAWAA